jgi:hypothetical protein
VVTECRSRSSDLWSTATETGSSLTKNQSKLTRNRSNLTEFWSNLASWLSCFSPPRRFIRAGFADFSPFLRRFRYPKRHFLKKWTTFGLRYQFARGEKVDFSQTLAIDRPDPEISDGAALCRGAGRRCPAPRGLRFRDSPEASAEPEGCCRAGRSGADFGRWRPRRPRRVLPPASRCCRSSGKPDTCRSRPPGGCR